MSRFQIEVILFHMDMGTSTARHYVVNDDTIQVDVLSTSFYHATLCQCGICCDRVSCPYVCQLQQLTLFKNLLG